jgi:hypothetical protein
MGFHASYIRVSPIGMIIYDEKVWQLPKKSPRICWHKFLAATKHIHRSIMKKIW